MNRRNIVLVVLAMHGAFAFPAGVCAQERVVGSAEIERLVRDPSLRRSLLRVGPGVVDSVAATSTVRLEAGYMVAGRTGLTAELVEGTLTPPGDPEPTGADSLGTQDPPSAILGRAALALPFRYLAPVADGSDDLVLLRAVYQVVRPLHYDSRDGHFTGSFLLALQDTARPQLSRPLSAPVRLQLAGDVDSLSPTLLEFDSTNFPLREVHVRTRAAADSVRVRIIPEFDLDGVDVWLGLQPTLTFETPPRRLQGLGIQEVPLTVSLRGGQPASPLRVSLDLDRGSVRPNVVEIQPGSSARVWVRSQGVGTARIRASSPGAAAAELQLAYAWPFVFLLNALLGGITGGIVARIVARGRGATAPPLGGHLVTGIGFGAFAALLYYAIGVNVLGVSVDIQHFDEAAVFAVAALAGFLGTPAAKLISRAHPRS